MDVNRLSRQVARAAALAAVVLAGCARGSDSAPVGQPAATPPDGPFGSGTISGVVRFAGDAPDNPIINMRAAPPCRGIYHSPPRQLSVIVNPNGTLANVFVYVQRGLPTGGHYSPGGDTVLLAQRGCQYHPRVFGLLTGQALAIRNDDGLAHQIDARGAKVRPFTIPLAAGRTTNHVFRTAEVMVPLRCRTHRWMRAYVGILPHPFFATTGDDGRFTIAHLPPGTYTLAAWHEGYGRRHATVTVTDTTTQRVTFTFGARAEPAN